MPLNLRKCFDHIRVWWNDESFGSTFNGSVWEPQTNAGEYFFNHIAAAGHQHCQRFSLVGWSDVEDATAKPIRFDPFWNDQGANSKMFSSKSPVQRSIWQPIPPPGYVALGMLGLGIEWHERNRGINPTWADFPKFRCIKLEYLKKLDQTLLQYEWRWTDLGSGSKRHISLYNAKFFQKGLKDKVHVCVGELGTFVVPSAEVYSFDELMVTFDEKDGDEEDTIEEKIRQNIGKAKAVCSGNFWRLTKVWKISHFILFSDHRLEYYKDNSGTVKGKNNPHSPLELRGSYKLTSVSSLTHTNPKTSITPKSSPSSKTACRKKSFRAIKSLLGQTPTPFVLELKVLDGKSGKFAFDCEEQMLWWYGQMKMFSIFVKPKVDLLSPYGDSNIGRYSGFNLNQRQSFEVERKALVESDKNLTKSEGSGSLNREEWVQLSNNSKWDRRIFWMRVIESGMKFSIIENTSIETLWNLYGNIGKDSIGKIELTALLTDWMMVRLDSFQGNLSRSQANNFLDNVSERALQGKKFLNVSRNGRVIFQEFKRIKKKAFWELMDENKPLFERSESRKMWKSVLSMLDEVGFLGDDEAFEVWERYDSTEKGTLTLGDIAAFLRDWVTSIGKLYPGAVARHNIDNFLDTIQVRAILAGKFLDPNEEGITFKRFQKIQEVEFWQHVDCMVTANNIHSVVECSKLESEASIPTQKFSWSLCKQEDIELEDDIFVFPSNEDESPPLSPRRHSSPGPSGRNAILSDAHLMEDPILTRKLNTIRAL